MVIEQQADRNMTGMDRKDPRVSDMIDLQRALVADHIQGLEREGAALRAERLRDHRRATDLPGVRVRLGQWLVGVGQSIAGSATARSRSLISDQWPCDDGPDALSPAA